MRQTEIPDQHLSHTLEAALWPGAASRYCKQCSAMAISPEYHHWCQTSGIKLHGIEAAFVEHGWRGVVATQDIQPGHVLLEVPEELLMTTRSARKDRALRAALEGTPGLSDVEVLGVHLLHELSRCQVDKAADDDGSGSSRWRLYIEHLPRSYTTLCNWSDEEVEALQLEHAVEVAAAAVHEARQQWQKVLPVLKELGEAWAGSDRIATIDWVCRTCQACRHHCSTNTHTCPAAQACHASSLDSRHGCGLCPRSCHVPCLFLSTKQVSCTCQLCSTPIHIDKGMCLDCLYRLCCKFGPGALQAP